jgi:hypothetical protein
MEGLTPVKTVNAGRCEEAVMNPEEGTTKHTKATKEQAAGM